MGSSGINAGVHGDIAFVSFVEKASFLKTQTKMKAFVAVLASALAAASGAVIPAIPAPVVPAATLVRAPAHDSATIESHRLGGNFAYATAEAHAYAKVTPQLATGTIPVAETTHIHTPAAIKTVQPAAIVTTKHVAQPILKQEQLYRNEPVIGPVATHTTYEQPLFKTRTYTHTGVAHHTQVAHAPAIVQAAPAIAPAAAIRYEAAQVVAAGLEAAALPAVTPFALGAGIAHPFAHGAAFAHGLPLAAEIAPVAVVAE